MPYLKQDEELMCAFKAGNPSALNAVYRAYSGAVIRYIQRLMTASSPHGHRLHAPDDVVQEVFVRAFSQSARDAYDGVRDYGPYLRTIARNLVFDAARTSQRETQLITRKLALDEPEVCVATESEELDCDPRLSDAVQSYLAALPHDILGVYQHRFVLGLTQEQSSSRLGVSRRTLRTREQHLSRGLRLELQRQGLLTRNCESFNGC